MNEKSEEKYLHTLSIEFVMVCRDQETARRKTKLKMHQEMRVTHHYLSVILVLSVADSASYNKTLEYNFENTTSIFVQSFRLQRTYIDHVIFL